MAWPDDVGEHVGSIAAWTVTIVGGILGGLKLFFGGKKDIRTDRAAERMDDEYEKFLARHAKLVERQDGEISRQATEISRLIGVVGNLTNDLLEERKAIHDLRREIVKLETQLFEALQRIAGLNERSES